MSPVQMMIQNMAWENGGGRIMGRDPTERTEITPDNTGAMITGRRTYDITDGWNGTHDLNHGIPVFVLTESAPVEVPEGTTPFTFVTDGIESAVEQAKQVAGDKKVFVGDGISLFKDMDYQISMAQTEVRDYAGVTHITYRLQ